MSYLAINEVSKFYEKHIALDRVSFNIKKQSIFGLLGPNGAGKTSLIRIINQITGADTGEIYFNGEKLSINHISLIGYLPEERGLYKKMKVGEMLIYLAQLKDMSKNDAIVQLKYWFEKYEIQTWWNKKTEELSKGMQQKVQFIATLVHSPQLIILDEPFTGFDPINTQLVKEEILSLKEKGVTIIFSTHRMESVEEICDDIVLINKSKIILEGSVKEIKEKFNNHTYRIKYKGEFSDEVFQKQNDYELIKNEMNGAYSTLIMRMLTPSNPNDLLKFLLPYIEVYSFQEEIPSLNEIFIKSVSAIN